MTDAERVSAVNRAEQFGTVSEPARDDCSGESEATASVGRVCRYDWQYHEQRSPVSAEVLANCFGTTVGFAAKVVLSRRSCTKS